MRWRQRSACNSKHTKARAKPSRMGFAPCLSPWVLGCPLRLLAQRSGTEGAFQWGHAGFGVSVRAWFSSRLHSDAPTYKEHLVSATHVEKSFIYLPIQRRTRKIFFFFFGPHSDPLQFKVKTMFRCWVDLRKLSCRRSLTVVHHPSVPNQQEHPPR